MTDKNITFIDGTQPAKCELCGKVNELRPYGPCAMKDEEEAKRQFANILNKGPLIIK